MQQLSFNPSGTTRTFSTINIPYGNNVKFFLNDNIFINNFAIRVSSSSSTAGISIEPSLFSDLGQRIWARSPINIGYSGSSSGFFIDSPVSQFFSNVGFFGFKKVNSNNSGYWSRGSGATSIFGSGNQLNLSSTPETGIAGYINYCYLASPPIVSGINTNISGEISLSWGTPSSNGGDNITGYKLYLINQDLTETLIYSGQNLFYKHLIQDNFKTYQYRLCATNTAGEGESASIFVDAYRGSVFTSDMGSPSSMLLQNNRAFPYISNGTSWVEARTLFSNGNFWNYSE